MSTDALLGLIAGFPLGFVTCCLLLSRWPKDEATMRRLYREYCLWRSRHETG